jgi:predicted Fe-Mo cluster-binding NifX family protein
VTDFNPAGIESSFERSFKMKMKMALPSKDDKVSPAFDTAKSLLVVEFENDKELGRHEETIEDKITFSRVEYLKKLGVKILICDSVSSKSADSISDSGITVIPWITGPVDDVVKAYLDGRLPDSSLYLP